MENRWVGQARDLPVPLLREEFFEAVVADEEEQTKVLQLGMPGVEQGKEFWVGYYAQSIMSKRVIRKVVETFRFPAVSHATYSQRLECGHIQGTNRHSKTATCRACSRLATAK